MANKIAIPSVLSGFLVLAGTSCLAQTVTVNTVEDIVDFGGARRVSDLPGPDGRISFREAVLAANNTPGAQTIEFAIPVADFWLIPGLALLKVENLPGGFWLTGDNTTIDFTSQTRNIGDTNPNGNEVGIYSLMSNFTLPQAGIGISANNCVIKGLDTVRNFGYGIRIEGNFNHVIGCHLFDPLGGGATYAAVAIRTESAVTPTGNVIGGAGPSDGNTLACSPGSGIEITGPAANNVVIGNRLIQSHVAGLVVQAGATGTRVGGSTVGERNLIAGNGTGGGGVPQDRDLLLDGVNGTRIEGNYFGTTPDGMSAATPPAIGIEMRGCNETTILNNVISGYRFEALHQGIPVRTGTGIYIATGTGGVGSNSTIVQGNKIGVAADGITPLPDAEGVHIDANFSFAMGVQVGGTGVGQPNTIANNAACGVIVTNNVGGVTISGNSIYSNGAPTTLFPLGGLGIDLVGPSGTRGVTSNDLGDGDQGGNGLQNFPVLTAAVFGNGVIGIKSSLNSLPLQTYRVEFFAVDTPNQSGYGEGRHYLGSTSVITDATGNVNFSWSLPTNVNRISYVTATATQVSTGNTSEFSAALRVFAR